MPKLRVSDKPKRTGLSRHHSRLDFFVAFRSFMWGLKKEAGHTLVTHLCRLICRAVLRLGKTSSVRVSECDQCGALASHLMGFYQGYGVS